MTAWIHNLDPVAIQLGGSFGIRWYGLAYAVAFVLGGWLMRVYHRKGWLPLNEEQQSNFLLSCMIGVLAGGRLGYVIFYSPETFLHPWKILAIWEGGMSSHGGFIGVTLAILWSARRYRVNKLKLGDVLVTLVPPGLLLGRLANFINGELWGNKTQVAWGVKFPTEILAWDSDAKLNALQKYLAGFHLPATNWQQAVVDRIQSGDEALRRHVGEVLFARHPSQLYEAALEGVLLLIYTQWRIWRTPALEKPGRLAGEFLMLYSVVRILGERFREPDADLIMGVSRGIFYSLFVFIGGLLLYTRSRIRNHPPAATVAA